MKKLLYLVMIAALVLSLAACGGNNSSINNNTNEAPPENQFNGIANSGTKAKYGADSLEELYEIITDLSPSNSYAYLTDLSYIFVLDGDSALLDCLQESDRNKDAFVEATNDRIISDANYYYSGIKATGVVKSENVRSVLEGNYNYALNEIESIGGSAALKEQLSQEYASIEEVWELRGEITYDRYTNNSSKANSSTYKLSESFYSEVGVELPFVFKINGKYFLGFVWY